MMRFALAILAYAAPTFALGYTWHLMVFEEYYQALQIYRSDIIVPFGFAAILIQGWLFAWIYSGTLARSAGGFGSRTLIYGSAGAALSWTFTTLTVAAKNIMASVPDFLLIETAFTLAQWIIVAPLTVLAFGYSVKTKASAQA